MERRGDVAGPGHAEEPEQHADQQAEPDVQYHRIGENEADGRDRQGRTGEGS